jgi:hypothetical protein
MDPTSACCPHLDCPARGKPVKATLVVPLEKAPYRTGREALRAAESGRGRAPHRAGVGRTARAQTLPIAGRPCDEHSRHRAPQRDISRATLVADTPEPSVGAADVHPAARHVADRNRRQLLPAACELTIAEDGSRWGVCRPDAHDGSRDHRSWWSVRELLSFYVPPPHWTPPKRHGRPSRVVQLLVKRWCSGPRLSVELPD